MGKLRKVKASTMPEALVAMTILVVIMLISFSVLASINNYTKSAFKLDAMMDTNSVIGELDIEGEQIDTLKCGRNRIIKEITRYKESKSLWEVRLTTIAPNGLILCKRNLIVVGNNQKHED